MEKQIAEGNRSKLKAHSIIGGGQKENRVENEVYPTPPDATHALMKLIDRLGYCQMKVWEPACDIGGMSKVIESYGHSVYSTDLRNTGYGIGGIDFLQCENDQYWDAIVTNPPFNISKAFIEKSMGMANMVCMLLKSQYWHAAKRANLFRKYKPAYICPLTWRPDFSGGGNPTMDVVWNIWIVGNRESEYMPLNKPDLTQLNLL